MEKRFDEELYDEDSYGEKSSDEYFYDKKNDEDEEPYRRRSSKKRKRGGFNMNKILLWIIGILLIISLALGISLYVVYKINNKEEKEPEITSAMISAKIEEVSDLTTSKMTYNGVIYYSEGEIPFITQKSYSMGYSAEVRAGFDISNVDVSVVGDTVLVKIPKSDIQSINVDPNSVNFFDEKHALFNWDNKTDGVEAIKYAEEDVRQNADLESLKSDADDNAKKVIYEVLENAVGDKQLVVESEK